VSGIYREDLVYVHDAGFRGLAQAAAAYLLERFDTAPHPITRILDIGCGSGITTRIFADAGFSVVGIEPSAAMINLARKAAPYASCPLYPRKQTFAVQKGMSALGQKRT
jgi:2-polyprenyl-3-methyl-5-hydroxy-6-metoxy-1,4-benzoquinol methylase